MPVPLGGSDDAVAAETRAPLAFLNDFIFTKEGTKHSAHGTRWIRRRRCRSSEDTVVDGATVGCLGTVAIISEMRSLVRPKSVHQQF